MNSGSEVSGGHGGAGIVEEISLRLKNEKYRIASNVKKLP